MKDFRKKRKHSYFSKIFFETILNSFFLKIYLLITSIMFQCLDKNWIKKFKLIFLSETKYKRSLIFVGNSFLRYNLYEQQEPDVNIHYVRFLLPIRLYLFFCLH